MKRFLFFLAAVILSSSMMLTGQEPAGAAELDTSIQFTNIDSNTGLIGGQQFPLQWNAPEPITDVSIYYSTDGGASWSLIASLSGNPGTYQWTVPTPSGWYVDPQLKLEIRRSFWEGIPPRLVLRYYYNISDTFRIINPNYVIPPRDLTATPVSTTSVRLDWSDVSSNETGFGIMRIDSGGVMTQIASVEANRSDYMVTGLQPDTEYSFAVYAFNASYSSSISNISRVTTLSETTATPPARPTDLTAAAISTTAIDLTWTDNAADETAFKVERSLLPNGGFTEIAVLPANTTVYQSTGLNPGTTYYFRVRAANGAGDSDYSNTASAATIAETSSTGTTDITQESTSSTETSNSTVMRFYIDNKQYYVNDAPALMDTAPVILNSRTLLPIRYVATPLGAEIDWNETEKKVLIKKGSTLIEIWINNNTALVNGVSKLIDPANPNVVPVVLPPGRTMLPLRFIAENLGCRVEWNGASREVRITYPGI